MIKPWRRRLLYTLIATFIGLGGGVVFYAQGWRLDISSLAFKKVGAIYVRPLPTDAQIFLDDKPVKNRSGLFDGGTFVNHLFPKTYHLALTREGYKDWKKTVTVDPSKVAEAKYAVLVPAVPQPATDKEADSFWAVRRDLLLRSASGTLLFRDHTLPGMNVIGWTDDSAKLLTQHATRRTYFWNDLATGTSTPFTLSGRVIVDPFDSSGLLLLGQRTLSRFDTERNSSLVLASSTNIAPMSVAPSPAYLAWTVFVPRTNASVLTVYDKPTGRKTEVNDPLPGRTVEAKWSRGGTLGILQNEGGLFLHAPREGTLLRIASDVKDFAFSPDASLLVALERRSVEIFSLNDKRYWRFNLPEIEKAEKTTWYKDGRHLIVEYPSRTAFLDLDDQLLENFQTIVTSSRGLYDESTNAFYFLKNKELFRLDFPA